MKLIENSSFITISNITDNVNNATSINFDIMIDKKQIVLPNNTDLILELNIIEGYLGLSFPTSDLLYKIERSSNLIKWETITQIKGNNDTYYYLTDDKLTDNSKYYRVKSID